jgi:hypothetical protein
MTSTDTTNPRRKSILKKIAVECADLDSCTSSDHTHEISYDSLSPSSSESERTSSPQNVPDDDEQSIHVKFQSIQIRNYDMTLGDNPSCNYGPPVALDWSYDDAGSIPLDDYEESRGTRRKIYQMHLNVIHRKRILERTDVTEDEIEYVVKEMKKIQKNREKTRMMLPFWKLEDAAESAKRKVKRANA